MRTDGRGDIAVLIMKLWNYFRGYVIIKIIGEYGERLLNQAAMNGLYLWDIKRSRDQELTAKIGVRDYVRLCRLTHKARCRVFIVERVGLFFLLNRLKRRKILLFGGALFIITLYILSSFIWIIDVNTDDELLKTSIVEELRELGIEAGTLKSSIEKRKVVDQVLNSHKDLAWAELQITGSKLIVNVVKKELPPELEHDTPCDIIASKDGIIEEVVALKGEAMVKPGDTVSAGDILISGKVPVNSVVPSENAQNDSNIMMVHAEGIVKARVWYQRAIKVPLIKEEKIYTGRQKKAIEIQAGQTVLKLQLGNIPFENYESEIIEEVKILPSFFKNVRFNSILYKEIDFNKEFLGVEGACREAEKQLLEEMSDKLSNPNITQKKTDFTLDQDEQVVIGSLIIEVIENIGKEKLFE